MTIILNTISGQNIMNDTTAAILRGMIFPRFITKSDSKNCINDSINDPKAWLDVESLYKDSFVLNSIAYYLFKKIESLDIDLVISEKRNSEMNSALGKILNNNEFKVKTVEFNKNNGNESFKNIVKDKNVCFVDDVVVDREKVNTIEKNISGLNGTLSSYVTIFNFGPPKTKNPVEVISLFNLNDIKRYRIWDLVCTSLDS